MHSRQILVSTRNLQMVCTFETGHISGGDCFPVLQSSDKPTEDIHTIAPLNHVCVR